MFELGKSRHKKRVLAVLDRVSSKLTQSEVTEAKELVVNHEQPAIALNLISTWLHNHQMEISKTDYNAIELACRKMNLSDDNWKILDAIVRD